MPPTTVAEKVRTTLFRGLARSHPSPSLPVFVVAQTEQCTDANLCSRSV